MKSAQFFLLEFPVFLSQDTSIRLAKTIEGFDLGAFARGTCRIHLPFLEASLCQDAICELWEEVKSRPGASMSLDGTSVTLAELKTAWRVHACGETYTSKLSCIPRQGWDWGCVFLAHIKPLENGKLLTPQALEQKLADIAERGWLHVCPHFHQELVEEKVEQYFRSAAVLSEKWVEKEPSVMLPSGATQQQTEPTQKIRPARYSDIGGLDKVVLALREAIELPLKHPEVLKHLGISPQRGCILCGPPGCGKTLLARAVATESRATFIPVSGPELVTKWYGESEERLREVFQKAQEKQPAIIFFDEIDAIAQSRSASESLRLDSKFTTQLLTLMDGIYDMGMVFVLAATNRIDLLDPALIRPGRFDQVITIPKPDIEACKSILAIHAAKLPLAADVDFSGLAAQLKGFTGAEIALLVREAAMNAFRKAFSLESLLQQKKSLSSREVKGINVAMQDFIKALETVKHRSQLTAQV